MSRGARTICFGGPPDPRSSPVLRPPRLVLDLTMPVLAPDWINEFFKQHSAQQYTREVLFSTTLDILWQVALKTRRLELLHSPLR